MLTLKNKFNETYILHEGDIRIRISPSKTEGVKYFIYNKYTDNYICELYPSDLRNCSIDTDNRFWKELFSTGDSNEWK